MNCVRQLVCLFLAAVLCVIPVRGEPAPDTPQAEYDGFLVFRQEEGEVSLFSQPEEGLEAVSDGLYWTESRRQAEDLLSAGWASYIEPNYYATLFDPEPDPGIGPVPGPARGWAWESVRADFAETLHLDGSGVRIAVIDSGVDPDNEDLREAHIAEGYDYLDETTVMKDTVYHGTKVLQMIAGDDNGLGVTGIARGAELVPLRCFSTSSNGTVLTLSRAVMEAVDVYHCDIINMSWGLRNPTEALARAIGHAHEAGVLLIAAAGNVGAQYPQGTLLYPAAYDEVIGVGAVDAGHTVTAVSQRTDAVTVCAPGSSLTLIAKDGAIVSEQGTSFAAPCVAAGAALLKQLVPAVLPEDFAALLSERSEDLGEPGYERDSGYGFLRLDLLFGTPWAKPAVLREDGETPCVTGWIPAEGFAALSVYDEDGSMVSLELTETGGNTFGFTLKPVFADRPDRVSLFLLDSTLAPLTPRRNYRLRLRLEEL